MGQFEREKRDWSLGGLAARPETDGLFAGDTCLIQDVLHCSNGYFPSLATARHYHNPPIGVARPHVFLAMTVKAEAKFPQKIRDLPC